MTKQLMLVEINLPIDAAPMEADEFATAIENVFPDVFSIRAIPVSSDDKISKHNPIQGLLKQ